MYNALVMVIRYPLKHLFLPLIVINLVANQVMAEDLPNIRSIAAFSVVNDDGEKLDQRLFVGKVTLVNFFFASCKGVCPAMQRRLLKLYHENPAMQQERVQILSISVDPTNDTTQKLQEYRSTMQLPKSWQLANTSKDELRRILVNELGLGSWEQPEFHTRRIALVDRMGSVRAYIPSDDEERLQQLPRLVDALLVNDPANSKNGS